MRSTSSYRDETESLQARVAHLEEELANKAQRVAELEEQRADQDAVFRRLEGVIDRKKPLAGRSYVLGAVLAGGVVLTAGAALVLRRAPASDVSMRANAQPPRAAPGTAPSLAEPASGAASPISVLDVCAHPGVRFTLAGDDAFAPAANERDLSGHKYRRDGSRSPWFTVNGGPIYVHGVGGFLPGNVGTTDLALLMLSTKGDTGGYTLAHGGKSFLEVQGADGAHVYGRFEADVSKVDDTTRTPPFGTPVVRVRGTFCLPAMKANPSDTGP